MQRDYRKFANESRDDDDDEDDDDEYDDDDDDDSDDGKSRSFWARGKRWLSLRRSVSSRSQLDTESSDAEAEIEAELLGSTEDKIILRDALKRFKAEDLGNEGDQVICAILMQVHQQTALILNFRTILSCGLWVLFKPKEDQGILILTKHGSVIKYGKGQESQPDVAWRYLEKVMLLFASVTMIVLLLSITISSAFDLGPRSCLFLAIFCGVALALFGFYLYAQRPRRDCGTTFRQNFEVDRLNFATYTRCDQGRKPSNFCMRRRQGHMRLCFGRFYPDIDKFNAGLPVGAPDVGGLRPVTELPDAMAGETEVLQRNKVEAEREVHGFGIRLSAFLAFMGGIGGYYDISTFVLDSADNQNICHSKRRGCHWFVPNVPWLGMQRTMPGVNPPPIQEGLCHGKPDESDPFTWSYCEFGHRRHDYCTEGLEGITPRFVLNCSKIPAMRDKLKEVTTFDEAGRMLVRYVALDDFSIKSVPEPGFPYGKPRMIEKGMTLMNIGGAYSSETKKLAKWQPLGFDDGTLKARCESPRYAGAMEFQFKHVSDTQPLDDADCSELQEACKAQSLGQKTNGWYPPSRLLSGDYDRTICWYYSFKNPWEPRRWNVIDDSSSGVTCQGEPIGMPSLDDMKNASTQQKISACQQACTELDGCNYAFVGKAVDPQEFRLMQEANVVPLYMLNSTQVQDVCWLYGECPFKFIAFGKRQNIERKKLFQWECGRKCDDVLVPCDALQVAWRLEIVAKEGESCALCNVQACRAACVNANTFITWCNGYTFSEEVLMQDGSQVTRSRCQIYGPKEFKPAQMHDGWAEVPSGQRLGEPDTAVAKSQCFVRLFPVSMDRVRAGRPGILMHWSARPSCGGCWTRSLTDFFFKTPSNVASVLANLVTVVGFLYIARAAQNTFQAGKVVFTGKPMVDMTITEDAANTVGFEERERAYNLFIQRCFELASVTQRPADIRDELDGPSTVSVGDCKVEEVDHQLFDHYDTSNASRTRCYVDRKLLGLLPGERIVHAWSDTMRHGWQYMLLGGIGQFLFLLFVCYLLPTREGKIMLFCPCAILIAARAFFNYCEYRREEQNICVITGHRRVIQLSRRPPSLWFLPWLGGVSFRLDVCHIGEIFLAQLDMPAVPLWRDRVRAAMVRRPWRRGVVAAKTEHGVLEFARKHGEALEVFRAVLVLAGSDPQNLPSVGPGGAEIEGFCPKRDLLQPGEHHVWEHKMDAYGFFGDPFNYVSLMSITNCRVIVTRVRVPKPLTFAGLVMGPLTFGSHCRALQEHRGTHAYITVTSISFDGLESYATARTRSPPFWPGFMAPRTSVSCMCLAKFMHSYPAGLVVTQRPYGMPLTARLKDEVRVARVGKRLLIVHSRDKAAPRGLIVVSVMKGGHNISMRSSRWRDEGGVVLGPGCRLTFEAADPEWNTYADEPWLRQMRQIFDHVLGQADAPEEAWLDLDEVEVPEVSSCALNAASKLLGAECFGRRFKHRTLWHDPEANPSDSEEGTEETGEDEHSAIGAASPGVVPVRRRLLDAAP